MELSNINIQIDKNFQSKYNIQLDQENKEN